MQLIENYEAIKSLKNDISNRECRIGALERDNQYHRAELNATYIWRALAVAFFVISVILAVWK
jgi:hypothetical protein